jgi:hypothetical protein
MKTLLKLFVTTLALFPLALRSQTNVRTLGVAGDGMTDDTAALQSAIDAGHSDLFFSKGSYRITRPLVLDLQKIGFSSLHGDGTASIRMEGPGPAIRIIGTHGGTAHPPTVKPGIWEKERSPVVVGLEIVGAHAEADGLEAEGTMQLTVERLVVRKARHGVHLIKRNRNVLLANCHVYENAGVGIFLDAVNLHQININNCHISNNKGGGVVSRGGEVRNLQIGTCDIESNHSSDGPPTANVLLDSTDGSIAEVAITGCTIQHDRKAPGSANIRILGAGSDKGLERRTGSPATREGHVTIGNNVLSDVQLNVEIRNSRGVTLTGNTFWMGFEHDLFVEDSGNIVISANNFDRNPRYQVAPHPEAERNGILIHNCVDSTFQGNVVSGVWRKPAAVQIIGGQRLILNSNSILDSDGVGLLLENLRYSVVSGNLVRDDRAESDRRGLHGIQVTGGEGNLLQGNLVREK